MALSFKSLVFMLFAAILTIGCLPEPLPIGDIPQLKSKIVVSTQLIPDQSLVVLLTRSVGALDVSDDSDPEELLNQIAINDALVILESTDSYDTLDFIENGLYAITQLQVSPNEVYTLHIESETHGSVKAITRAMPVTSFISVSAEIFDTGFDTLATIDYALEDLAGPNYYMINVQRVTLDSAQLPEPEDFLNPTIFTHLFTDEGIIDGSLINDSFTAFFRRDFIPGDTVMIQLANISPEYFNFLQLRLDTRFNFAEFLGEPVNFPSNVEGGLGWFTLHIPDIQIRRVEQQ
jgi:hypothetical protein